MKKHSKSCLVRNKRFISIYISMNLDIIGTLFIGSILSVAAGVLGSFAVLKRMTLAGDVLSHVALPGIGLALFLGISQFLGAFVALVVAAFAVWGIRNRTNLPEETVIGTLFASSLALGILLTPGEELIDALFGGLGKVSVIEGILVVGLSLIIIILMVVLARKIVFSTVSPELAKVSDINPEFIELVFLVSFAIIIALGVRFTGTLLMGALIIMPAAASKNLSRNLKTFISLSVFFALISTAGGFLFSHYTGILPGPISIFISSLLFSVSILFRLR